MFHRTLFCVLASVSAGSIASAQVATGFERGPSAPRHAGIFHVSTGTWTRTAGAVAAFGPDVVYSNNAPSGYYSSAGGSGGWAAGSEVFDEGGLPGRTNGHVFATAPDRNNYSVNGFRLGYCDHSPPGAAAFRIRFFSSYTPCTFDGSPDETVTISGLPAGGSCWIVDIDLSGGEEFCLDADGGPDHPGWDDDPNLDSFGWSWTYTGTSGALAGLLLAGNPAVTDPGYIAGAIPIAGGATYFGSTQCGTVGTGYLTQDFRWNEDPTGTFTGCYFFGGYSNSNGSCTGPSNPLASYHFEVVADSFPCGDCACGGLVYCMTNDNSLGVRTKMELLGSADPAQNDLTLRAYDLPNNVFGFFITSQTQGFVAYPGGSGGNLCLGGDIGRFVGPGQIKNSGVSGEMTLSTTAGEWSVDAIPQSMTNYAAVAGITSNFQLWHRSGCCDGFPSNFSDGVSVTWR